MKKWLLMLTCSALFTYTNMYAQNFTVVGTTPTQIKITVPPQSTSSNTSTKSQLIQKNKTIYLMKIRLSEKAQAALKQKARKLSEQKKETRNTKVELNDLANSSLQSFDKKNGSHVNLKMNGVPVLDQGQHGACVTFAISAALDALIHHGDYISELCSLELGKALAEKDQNYPSGWEGSLDSILVDQFRQYGAINKRQQHHGVCMGVKKYPKEEPNNTGRAMPKEKYQQYSENVMGNTLTEPMINDDGNLLTDDDAERALEAIKQQLRNKHRVILGTVLDIGADNAVGAVGQLNGPHDTWMVTQKVLDDISDANTDGIFAGHEMVIIGYDDKATVFSQKTDTDSPETEQGVLILRNSWGPLAGDQGNYYMTYHYFKLFVMNAQALFR